MSLPEGGPWRVRFESPEDRGRRRHYGTPKTREFSASLVAFTTANGVFELGQHDPLRPALAIFALSRAEEGPFVANLRAGRKLLVEGMGSSSGPGHSMEFMKSAEYEVRPQRLSWMVGEVPQEGVVLEVFVRELFEFAPVIAREDTVSFLLSETEERYQRESASFDRTGLDRVLDRFLPRPGEGRYDFQERTAKRKDPLVGSIDYAKVAVRLDIVMAEGRRFAAAIDRRADVPLLPDPLFGVQILCSALAHGFAQRSDYCPPFSPYTASSFCEVGMYRTKRAPGLAFKLGQSLVQEWLASEVTAFDNLRLGAKRRRH